MTDYTVNEQAVREGRLQILFDVVLDDLIERITDGTATPSEKATAAKLLKDNQIGVLPTSERLQELGQSAGFLPSDDEFDDAEKQLEMKSQIRLVSDGS